MSFTLHFRRSTVIKSAVALALATAWSAAAGQSVLQEITVTAQKREQGAQDVGISMTALTGDQVRALGLSGASDIVGLVPSLQIMTIPGLPAVFNIRGVSQNDFADHLEAPVAVFVDDAYVSGLPAVDMAMFDIERIEVLRGPQGTLFGRNATGGLIHYLTRRPRIGETDGYLQLSAGDYGLLNLEGAVNVPLGQTAAARLSATVNQSDGWVTNRIGPDLHETDSYAYRAQLLWKPTDALDMLASIRGVHNDDTTAGFSHDALKTDADGLGTPVADEEDFYGTCAGCDPRGYRDYDGDPWAVDHDKFGVFTRDLTGAALRLEWDGPVGVTAISDYFDYEKIYESDSDASNFDIARYDTRQDYRQFSQELRLDGTAGNAQWVAGLYYLDIEADQVQAGGAFGVFVSEPAWTVTTQSWAAFGQADIKLGEKWALVGGFRYTEDKKEMNYIRTDNGGGLDVFDRSNSDLARRTFDNVSAKLGLNWQATDDILAYGSITRGHKGGSFVAPLFPPVVAETIPHDEEVVLAYEIGLKSTLLDGRMRLNGAAFHYDYDDYQAFSFANLVQAIYNVDARITGMELELQANPLNNLDVVLGLTLLDGKAEDVELPSGRIADRDLPMAPDFSVNGLVRYRWTVGSRVITAQADFKYLDDFYFYVLNQPAMLEEGYLLGNVKLGYGPEDGRWEVAVFARNVTNEEYRIYANDISVLGHSLNNFGPPRWVGVSAYFSW